MNNFNDILSYTYFGILFVAFILLINYYIKFISDNNVDINYHYYKPLSSIINNKKKYLIDFKNKNIFKKLIKERLIKYKNKKYELTKFGIETYLSTMSIKSNFICAIISIIALFIALVSVALNILMLLIKK